MALLYATKGGNTVSDLYTIDPATEDTISVGPIGESVTGIAFDPTDGTLYGSTARKSPNHPNALITIDPDTGASTFIAYFTDGPVADIAIDATGQMYGWTESDDSFVVIDKTNGNYTLYDQGISSFGDGMDFSPVDGLLYAFPKGGVNAGSTDSYDQWGTFYTINLSDGTMNLQGLLSGGPTTDNPAINSASFAADGTLFAIYQDYPTNYLITIDTSTGVVTNIYQFTDTGWDGLAWGPGATVLTARFSRSPISGMVPLTVNFVDHSVPGPSGPITSYDWDFGDGVGTSSSPSPTYAYTSTGTFVVSLTVTSADGTSTVTHPVTVFAPQTAYIAMGQSATDSDLYTLDTVTGELTDIGPIGFALTGLCFDPITGTLYGMTSNNSGASPHSLITINPTTGAGTLIGDIGLDRPCNDIAIDSTGALWGWYAGSSFTIHLMSINKSTGVATPVGTVNTSRNGGALAFNSADVLFLIGDNNNHSVYQVDMTTSATNLVHNTVPGTYFTSGKFDVMDGFWGIDNNGNLAKVDVTNGNVTTVVAIDTTDYPDAFCWSPELSTPDFNIGAASDPTSIGPGNAGDVTLHIGNINANTETITLSATGVPSGVTVTFADNPVHPGDTTSIHVTVDSSVPNGVYNIVIHGTGTLNTHLTTIHLWVTTGISLSINPTEGPCGIEPEITGYGFAPSSPLTFTWGGTDYSGYASGMTSDASGNVDIIFTSGVPGGFSEGDIIPVTVRDGTGLTGHTTFVYHLVSFTMSPSQIKNVNSNITFAGSHFEPGVPMTIQANTGVGRIGGGNQWVDVLMVGATIVSGSLTIDSSGNFSVVIHFPKNSFSVGSWNLRVLPTSLAETDGYQTGGYSGGCTTAVKALSVCSSQTTHDDTSVFSGVIPIVGHPTHDWPVVMVGGSSGTPTTQVTTPDGHIYDVVYALGTVHCGTKTYSLFWILPIDSVSHSTLPIPSWYHKLMVYEISDDGSTANYYFIDPQPHYAFNLQDHDFIFSNNWTATLSFSSWDYVIIHAKIVTDGTNVWVGVIAAESKDYPYISGNDGHGGQPSQATQQASRGNLASMVAQWLANPSVGWDSVRHDQTGPLDQHQPHPPDSDSGDNFSGVFAQAQLSVFHFNGSGFDELGGVDALYNWVKDGSANLQSYGYVSGLAACASPAEPGVAHFIWSEGGPWGRRYDGVDGSGAAGYFVWDSDPQPTPGFFNNYGIGCANLDYRMNYSRWSASGRTLNNDIRHVHIDRSSRYWTDTGGGQHDVGLPSSMPCSNQIILKNEHGSPIAIVSNIHIDFDGNTYSSDYYDSDIRFWDLSSGSIVELQTLDSSILPQPNEVSARYATTGAVDVDRLATAPDFGVPDVQRIWNDGLGHQGMIISNMYADPLLSGQNVYLIGGMFFNVEAEASSPSGPLNTHTIGFYRIPCDGSATFDVMDGDRTISIMPNPTPKGWGLSLFAMDDFFVEPRNIWMLSSGLTRTGPIWFYGQPAVYQLDRVCNEGWLEPYTWQGSQTLEVGGQFTYGSIIPSWADYGTNGGFWFDGTDKIYVPAKWWNNSAVRLYAGVGYIQIHRNGAACSVCVGVQPSIFWFFKDGAWHMAGDTGNTDNLWFFKDGQWHQHKVDPLLQLNGQLITSWQN